MEPLSVVMVEDSALFALAVSNVLRKASFRLHVFPSNRIRQRPKLHQSTVVVDAVTWAAGRQELIEAIRQISTSAPVIVLGRPDMLDYYLEALQAGATGFVRQTASRKELLKAIKAVSEGQVWFERSVFRKIFVDLPSIAHQRVSKQISARERDVLSLVASGRTNKEIAIHFGLTERTIKGCVSGILKKLALPNRSALGSYAARHGLAEMPSG